MDLIMDVTKRSHFVWKYYLRSWADENSIFCSICGKSAVKISLKKVANKRYFYEITPFNDYEKDLLLSAIDKSLPKDIIENLVRYINSIDIRFKHQSFLNVNLNHDFNRQLGEDLMTADEKAFRPFIDNIKKENIDYCVSPDNIIVFYIYVAMQYMRTKRIFEDLKKGINENIDIQNIITPFRRIMSFNIANYFIQTKSKTLLLKNNTQQEFITSDQPVINTCVDYSILDKHTDKLEFYYPITPKIAILITNDIKYENISNIDLNLNDVDFYNKKIIKASDLQVFSSTITGLDRYGE